MPTLYACVQEVDCVCYIDEIIDEMYLVPCIFPCVFHSLDCAVQVEETSKLHVESIVRDKVARGSSARYKAACWSSGAEHVHVPRMVKSNSSAWSKAAVKVKSNSIAWSKAAATHGQKQPRMVKSSSIAWSKFTSIQNLTNIVCDVTVT